MDLIDVVALRPRNPDQLPLLATRLNVPLGKDWLRTMRWAGRALLGSRLRRAEADRVLAAAREAGVRTLVRPSHHQGAAERFAAAHAKGIGRALFVIAASATFVKLLFFRNYNMLVHFLGLLWLNLIGRDMRVFGWAGRAAGTLTALVIGYLALISFHAVLAWTRLSPPLIAEGGWYDVEHVQPLPPDRSVNKRRFLPWVLGGAAAALLLVAGIVAFQSYGIDRGRRLVLTPVAEARRLLVPLPADPWKARAELEDRIRPRPDRRFLLALSDVDRIVHGRALAATAEWTGAAWRIAIGGEEVGSLSPVPSFGDALALVRLRASRLLEGVRSAPAAAFAGGSDDDALAALRKAQAAWSKDHLDREAIHQAATALTLLSFHALDEMEVADPLSARAMAALAVDEELTAAREVALEALLASAMDYSRAAAEAAEDLRNDDPVRHYVLRDDDELRVRAAAGTAWEALLWRRRLDALFSEDPEEVPGSRLAEVAHTVAANRLRLTLTEDVRAESIRRALPLVKEALERELLAERRATLWGRARSVWFKPGHSGPLLEAFEADLADLRGDGPLLDRQLVAAYYRAAFYSGARQVREQLQDHYGSAEAARAFVTSLGEPGDPLAQQFLVYLRAPLPWVSAGEYVQGKPLPDELAASLPFGPRAILEAIRPNSGSDHLVITHAQRISDGRLDTRPAHRRFLAREAVGLFHDPVLIRRACGAVLQEADELDAGTIECAWRLRNKDALLEVARSDSVALGWRVYALGALEGLSGVTAAEIDAEFEELASVEDGRAQVVEAQEKRLEDRHEYARAREVVERWLTWYPGLSVNAISMRTAHARLLQKEGHPEEAWREVEPLIGSGHGAPLMRGTYLLLELGRPAEAEAMARQRLDRFTIDWASLDTLLEVLWRIGKSDAATERLVKPPFPLDLESWHSQIGASFARAFKGRSDEDALAAFQGLRRAGVSPRELRELTVALGEDGRLALESAMLTLLVDGGANDSVTLVRGAVSLAKSKGESAAKEWLGAHLKADDLGACARAMYELRQDRLLWSALPDPPEASADRVWLLRAASLQRSPELRREHGDAIQKHFSSPAGSEPYLAGRYVAGFGDEAPLRSAGSRTRTAWALAVRAEADGRRDDAIAWYGVALASTDWTEAERRFADQRLSELVEEK